MSTEAKKNASQVDETKYGLRVELQASYETAIERITAELKKQGRVDHHRCEGDPEEEAQSGVSTLRDSGRVQSGTGRSRAPS